MMDSNRARVSTTESNSNLHHILAPSLSLRPPVYKMGDDLGQYLAIYQRIAEANNWTEEQKKNFLIVSFPNGSVHQSICIMADPGMSFLQLLDELKRMIGVHEPRLKLAQYETRVLREGETVGEYERALRLLYCAAMGQASKPDADPRYLLKFIDGLPIRWRSIISAEMHSSVAGEKGALLHAQRLEAAEKLHVPDNSVSTNFGTISAVPEVSTGVSVFPDVVTQLQKKLDDLTLLVQELRQSRSRKNSFRKSRKSRNEDTESSNSEEEQRDRSRSSTRRFTPSRVQVSCTYCKKAGHSVDHCRTLKRKICESCGRTGHTTAFCRRGDNSNARPSRYTSRQGSFRQQENW